MKRLAFVLSLLLSTSVYASHIVGGEIEMLHVGPFRYRINLIYYFDVAHNPDLDPQAEEPFIQSAIFRKSDDMFIQNVTLNWSSKHRVPYTQPDCSSGEIITDKITYSNPIDLF